MAMTVAAMTCAVVLHARRCTKRLARRAFTSRGRRRRSAMAAALFAFGAVTPARATELTLEPSGSRPETTAMWVNGRGPSEDRTDEVLLLRKESDTPMIGAVVAVRGLAGLPIADLRQLAWDRREDGACSGSAPTWGLAIEGRSGATYVAYLTCAEAAHSPTSDDRWTHDEFSSDMVQRAVRRVGGSDSEQGRVRAVAIIFEDGPRTGPGYAYLDNVTVNGVTWRASDQTEISAGSAYSPGAR